ncbi:hypothetical protein ES707_07378 [subsurface metagenome]
MVRNLVIRGTDEETYVRMRMLCIGKGLTMPQLLKELVDNAYQTDKTIPSKTKITKMKRFVKRLK